MLDGNTIPDQDNNYFLRELEGVTPQRDTYFSIGVFDGVHIGHHSLISRLLHTSAENGCQSGVITFHPTPVSVLRPGVSIRYLTDVRERVDLIKALGVDIVLPVTFTLELSIVTARDFVDILMDKLRLKGLVLGADFALGYNREGTVAFLTKLGHEMGFSVEVVSHKDFEGARVSSTAIRAAIAEGDIATANKYLGRIHTTSGKVISGDGRGRALGFPTANMSVWNDLAIPPDGIYATRVRHKDELYLAATYVGSSPTFDGRERAIEAYLMDFTGDLYGEEIVVEWIDMVREDRTFNTPSELRAQMEKDVMKTKKILGA